MAIPRGEVEAGVNPGGLRGGDKLLNDVAGAIFPRTSADRMAGVFGRPEAEAVMVFCGQDHQRNTCIHGCSYPLVCVEADRVEYSRVFVAGAPFGVGERVDSEVKEHDDLPLLPFELGK